MNIDIMSMISVQVKELRECVEEIDNPLYDEKIKRIARLMRRSADTIEALSAKVAANMELSVAHYNCGWIPCNERLPEEDTDVLIYTSYDGVDMAYISDGNWRYTREDEFINTIEIANILAWMPFPTPYRPDKES
ncbi:MAG: DUF551 domain-containing protein [Roseburia sp.]|nr:DUF551 domain-containing protein [Roseburia sp.]